MPLGDSITYGSYSTTGNGYRQTLLDLLLATPLSTLTSTTNTTSNTPSNTSTTTTFPLPTTTSLPAIPTQPAFPSISYVGTQHSGNMTMSSNEGYPGYHISQIASRAAASIPMFHPNLILLMAGTNDIVYNDSLSSAPARLGSLIDMCFSLSPSAVVVVAQLTPFANETLEAATKVYNAGVVQVVGQRAAKGAKVVLVDMQGQGGVGVDDLYDGEHPDDGGYDKMADVWYQGVLRASSMGWITGAVGNGTSGSGTGASSTSAGVGASPTTAKSEAGSGMGLSAEMRTIYESVVVLVVAMLVY